MFLRLLPIVGFILFGVVSRWCPHPPNFTAMNAIAVMAPFYFRNEYHSFMLVACIQLLTDLFLGFHLTCPYVYLSLGLTVFLIPKNEISLKVFSPLFFTSSFLFFAITNFGVWMMESLYPKTIAGLSLCYIAGIPFFFNQILGDIFYSILLFAFLKGVQGICAIRQ